MGEVATRQENQQPTPTWPQLVERAASKFNQIADRHKLVTWVEESQFALQAIQNNDKLAMCAPRTVQNAIINVASIGLTLQPALGYAYLVPDSVKQKDASGRDVWVNVCTLKVSFKGLLKIATDSGSIKWCKAEVVKEGDTFEYNGPCSLPKHIMQPFSDRGKTTGVYCIAKTHDGDYLVDILDAAGIQKIKSKAKTKTVWDDWEDEMAKKAIIKRASKQWPKTEQSDRLDQAVEIVNESEGSEPLVGEVVAEPRQLAAPRKQAITDARLTAAIAKIKSGEYSKEALFNNFALTDEQVKKVNGEVPQ
ncbi:MAG: recombinase RecT [Candidatus Paceibacterota bacterium]|jgi:recombination protein RecT